jgi:squalene synthase HpnC
MDLPPSDNRALMTSPAAAHGVDHYENFPVASWLCPPALRPAVAAIYWFARTADDLADEGEERPSERLAALAAYRVDLQACLAGAPASGRWAGVFGPLAAACARHQLPPPLLHALLDAFEQDVRKTAAGAGYADRDELLAYCRRSADPVGRLLLHLYGVGGAQALAESDAICSALQLANFWQDLSRDLPRRRYYLPAADCAALGVDPRDPASADPAARVALLRDLCGWTRGLMQSGAPLVHRIPGRAGWELRCVVQGGLRILDKIAAQGHDTLRARPAIGRADALPILWRAARMGQSRA